METRQEVVARRKRYRRRRAQSCRWPASRGTQWVPGVGRSASLQAREFILSEFFNLDGVTLHRVIQLYGREYGQGARRYLESTFDSWRNGSVTPRRDTQDRFLHCVPRYLSSAKQFTILSFYIPEFMARLMAQSNVGRIQISELSAAFTRTATRCRDTTPTLDWFVQGVFSGEEIDAFADVARYTVFDRLHRCYCAARSDLHTVTEYLSGVDANVTMEYKIETIHAIVALDGAIISLPAEPFELPRTPALVERHREQYERLLVEHHADMIAECHAQEARHSVARLDLSILKHTISSAAKRDSMDSTFVIRGGAGQFEGRIWRKNIAALKAQFAGRILAAGAGTLGLLLGIIAAFASERHQDWGGLGVIVAFIAVPWVWSWAIEKQGEIREYERAQSTGFAKILR